VALSGLEITALEDYLDIIKPAGTQINVVSLTADKLYIFGTVFYSGQYSDVISDNVEAALNDYMTNLSSAENFDGIVRVIEIIDAIQAVEGVVDVNITEVGCRADTVAFASRTVVYKLSTGTNLREYTTVSGYIVEETESGSEFANTLTYTSV
jgi:phage-related holin